MAGTENKVERSESRGMAADHKKNCLYCRFTFDFNGANVGEVQD